MRHLVFPEPARLPQSRVARLRDAAIHLACELLAQANDVSGFSNRMAPRSNEPRLMGITAKAALLTPPMVVGMGHRARTQLARLCHPHLSARVPSENPDEPALRE
jgi:hypothetical protein